MQLYTVFIHWTQTQHSCFSFPFPMSLNWTHKTCQSPINLNLCQWQVSPSTWQVWYIKMLIKTARLFSLCNTVSTVETFWSLGSNVYTCLRSCGSSSPEQSSSLFPAPPSLPGCGSDTTLNTLLLPTGHDADEQLHQPHLVNNKCVYIICRLIYRMYRPEYMHIICIINLHYGCHLSSIYSLFIVSVCWFYCLQYRERWLVYRIKVWCIFIFNQPCKENLKLDREIWRYEEEEEEISSW